MDRSPPFRSMPSPARRAPYAPPRLVVLGEIRSATLGVSSVRTEPGGGKTKDKPGLGS